MTIFFRSNRSFTYLNQTHLDLDKLAVGSSYSYNIMYVVLTQSINNVMLIT